MGPSPPRSVDESLSRNVIEAVATEMNIHPTELPEPLYDALDPDALDVLFVNNDGTGGEVTFNYCSYSITVTAEGNVSVET
ncbi:HalOD1 output domain-containing protein [Halocatena pleomorpha]|uniref:Halobacterial output domain-containing protein n=1 Tax=Halocatena pleomorpha TaxID=1785090 RepID=A0A3P3R7Z9_9EURY|nr:HalOD1 output domain-containing protein [Halocatena pleomorpha]RRJ29495.1 hypothetical protein EIK79_12720 [Halocatena pleomorpha]